MKWASLPGEVSLAPTRKESPTLVRADYRMKLTASAIGWRPPTGGPPSTRSLERARLGAQLVRDR